MGGSLSLVAPGSIIAVDGVLLSLDLAPPGGIAVGATASSVTLTLTSTLDLSVGAASGATISSASGALTLSGALAAVNEALASLLIEANFTGSAALTIAVAGVPLLAGTNLTGPPLLQTLSVTAVADTPPAFIAPPASLALSAGIATPLPLTLADDPAVALGPGAAVTLAVTLLASDGVFLLPAAVAGLDISGAGSETLVLVGNAADMAAFDAVLAGISLNEAGNGTVEYSARQSGGALPAQITSGSLIVSASGTLTPSSATWLGGAGDWQESNFWSASTVPNLASDVTMAGSATIAGDGVAAALTIAAGATLDLTGSVAVAGSLALGGVGGDLMIDAGAALTAGGAVVQSGAWLADFGALTLDGLDGVGTALLPGGGTLAGPLAVAAGGTVDFAGVLQAGAAAPTTTLVAISLAANAVLAGAGTLLAGNFSQSDILAGPGTVLALGPAPLTLDAGSIGGGVNLLIEPGAVLELAPVAPLYGVFNPTPITVGSDATISFAPGASPAQNQGGFASPRGEQGGVLVIDDPLDFAASFSGFVAGDRIVLPTLTSLTVFNVSAHSFLVSGIDPSGASEIITINTSLPPGTLPVVETDQAGQSVIGLRASAPALSLNDTPANAALIDAAETAGIGLGETIIGLGLQVPVNPSGGMILTITADHGAVALAGAPTDSSSLTLSARSALALDDQLAALVYTPEGAGSGDVLNFIGGTGLAGLTAAIGVTIAPAATLFFVDGTDAVFDAASTWLAGAAPANGDVAVLGSHQGAPILLTGPGEAGALAVQGGFDLAGSFVLPGIAGVALSVAASGFALFDANAVVTLGGSAQVSGGTLGLAGAVSAPGQTLAIDQGWLELTGSVSAGGLVLGDAGPAQAGISGALSVSSASLGGVANGVASGAVAICSATGQAVLDLGAVTASDATMALGGSALLQASVFDEAAGAVWVTQDATLQVAGAFSLNAGALLSIGPVATFSAATLAVAGLLSEASARTTLVDGLSLQAGGSLALNDGSLTLGTLSIASGASLSGYGEIGAAGVGLAMLDNQGALTAVGGVLDIGATLLGGATIAEAATLDLAGAASQGTIAFGGMAGLLSLSAPTLQHDAVIGLAGSDAIDLRGVAPGSVQINGGTVSIAGAAAFALGVASGPAMISSDGAGGSLITDTAPMPCFVRGTSLLTPNGYRAVETIAPGDALVTASGRVRAVAWVGWRSLDLATASPVLRPIFIARGAFAPCVPRRDLRVSPLHAIAIDGVLVPACLLVNGATITRDDQALTVTYFHIELSGHDVLLAEGLACESYRDTGNRARFAHGRGVAQGVLPACLPLLTGGTKLAALRADLHQRAERLGYRIAHGLAIEALVGEALVGEALVGGALIGDAVIAGRLRRGWVCFEPPTKIDRLVLRMRAAIPAETDPASEDRRELGFCAGAVRVDGRPVAAELGAGWYSRARDDRGVWSGAWAQMRLPRAGRRVRIEVVGRVPRWLRPDHGCIGGG
ncbi:MAG: Hint domain-containing protein [Acidiphilium sp.]